jgi:hypothetical protein
MRRAGTWRLAIPIALAMLLIAASVELAMGRHIWGVSGQPGIWSGDVNSSHNSQYLFDPYSFSHITHGILLYGLIWLLARNWPIAARFIPMVGLECMWEMVENTNFVINRYRTATISLHYFGDSVMNSMCDILSAVVGFTIAAVLPPRVSAVFVIALELSLILWIRDSLLLNIVMLIWPIAAIRHWQAGLGA